MKNQSLKRRKLYYGLGRNDADYPVNAGNVMCPCFRKWVDMFTRCYSGRCSAYDGCSVDPAWFSFMAFRAWMLTQDWVGKALDKDYVKPGNKVYGPDTCAFVNQSTNNFNREKPILPGHQEGVKQAPSGRYAAYTKINGKFKRIGTYDTKEEASKHYLITRSDYALVLAGGETDVRVVEALRALSADYLLKASFIQ